jgi:hypothetical protein
MCFKKCSKTVCRELANVLKTFGSALKILIIHYFFVLVALIFSSLSPLDLYVPVVQHDRNGLVVGVHCHRLAVHRHIPRQREFSNCNPDYGITNTSRFLKPQSTYFY